MTAQLAKIARFLALIGFLCGLGLGLTPALAEEEQPLDKPYVVVVNDAPPFRIIEQWENQSGYSGAYIDTIKVISQRTKLPLKFVNVPFARALAMMKAGSADMMLGPNWSVERSEYMYYLKASFPAESKVFYLSDIVVDVSRYSELKDLTIGVLRGARYFDRFDQDDSLDKVQLNDYASGFKMLAHRRLDAMIIPERQGRFLQRSLDLNFHASSFQVPGKPSFITISHHSKLIEHKDKIEAVMADLNAEGFFERLMTLYLH